MSACGEATIAGFNQVVRDVGKATEGSEVKITLVVFSDNAEFASFCEPVGALRPLTWESYEPDGQTAMLDAVMTVLRRFVIKGQDDPETRYLMTIVSDGEENASREFSYKTISKIIEARQNPGRWTFAYMGANQDLAEVSERTSILRGNTSAYVSSPQDSRAAFMRLAYSSGRTFIGMSSPG
jgi:hypothetical protein